MAFPAWHIAVVRESTARHSTIGRMSFKRNFWQARRNPQIKGLLWDEAGFLLLYKRLEDGKYQWPDGPEDMKEISEQQIRGLTEGFTISPSKLVRKVHPHFTI